MPTSQPNLKGFTAQNWDKRWEMIEKIVELARADRTAQSLPLEFKLNKKDIAHYLNRLQESDADITEIITNSIVVFPNKIIAMDKNPEKEGSYEQRYLGSGRFGRVKLGKDKEGNAYALKVERKKSDKKSAQERAIMQAIGVRIGGVSYQTDTTKPWLDEKPIHEKELTVMKLIPGKKLSAFLLYDATPFFHSLDIRQKMLIAIGIIRAINNLNNYGIAHRDTKADNFMLDITQLPLVKELSEDNIAAYLRGELPGYDLNSLIREIDWGIASPISIDPLVFERADSNRVRSLGYTAPEYYISKTYSRLSEAYTVAKLLKNGLGFDFDILSKILPNELVSAVNDHEERTLHYNNHFRFIQNMIKKNEELIDPEIARAFSEKLQNLAISGTKLTATEELSEKLNDLSEIGIIEPTTARELLEKLNSLAEIRDESQSKLTELLNIYPPHARPSLLELSNDFEMRLNNITRNLQARSQFQVAKQPANTSNQDEFGYEEELQEFVESFDEFEGSGYQKEIEEAVRHEVSHYTSSEESITKSQSSVTSSNEEVQRLGSALSNTKIGRAFTTSFSRSQMPEIQFPQFATIENDEERNDFFMTNCVLVEKEALSEILQTQSIEDLRELLSFASRKGGELMLIESELQSAIEEQIEAEIKSKMSSQPLSRR